MINSQLTECLVITSHIQMSIIRVYKYIKFFFCFHCRLINGEQKRGYESLINQQLFKVQFGSGEDFFTKKKKKSRYEISYH